MSERPLVSVVCTCYNKSRWIRQSLESVLAQVADFPIEVIVVDDASTDDSLLVIEECSNAHPGRLKIFLQEENLGCSATRVNAVRQVTGDYVALIDADDYWTDERKLACQVDALRNNPDSGWCCTDFDMIDAQGNLICANAIRSGAIAKVDSFEQMLAVKGFTNPSTWLVETSLMREAIASVLPDTADDSFNIQLELFKKTNLTRLDLSQSVMRFNHGSDSRPLSYDDAAVRFKGLMRQQLDFLYKYSDTDYRELARYLIEQDTDKDFAVFERDRKIDELSAQLADQLQLNADLQARIDQLASSRSRLSAAKSAVRGLVSRFGR